MENLTKQTLKIYWDHGKKYPWHVFGILSLLFIYALAEGISPFLYKQFINNLIGYDFSKYKMLIGILILILSARTIRSISYRSKDYLTNFFEPRVMDDLSNTCFDLMHQNSYSFFSGNFVGSLVNKVKKMERGFEIITDRIVDDFLRTFLAITLAVALLSYTHLILGMAVLVWCALYTALIYWFSLYKLKYDLKKSELDTKITAQLADTITNNTNIKLFSNFEKEKKAFHEITEEHFKIRRFSWDLMTYLEILQSTLMLIIEGVMMYLALRFWKAGSLSVGDFTLIQLYLISIFDRLWGMGKQVRTYYEALADANEMTEIILQPREINDIPTAKALKLTKGKIEFKNVDFRYHKNAGVLKKFNLEIGAGERVALIGPSGGGKSTIVKLLMRFHDVLGGKILIDGQDISKVTQDSLRENLSLVPQDPILFHRSLMENIRYSKNDASDEEVIAAAKAAHAHEFISRSAQGYNTFVGERGIKLSGGERQRVAIARAILKNAPILVLDEATSSLDSESEHYIQDALKNLMATGGGDGHGKTVIVIAHRLSTIMQMDRIIVLENGAITEQGKHEELIKAEQGTYQKLWEIQAGGFSPV
jgi:ATP-binding cassette, subfamily B, bacterial